MRIIALAPLFLATAVMAQDQAAMDEGAVIFDENCAFCHMENGMGDPPSFPALAGNENLADAAKIVSNIWEGQGNMPPFTDLEASQVAAVSTYIRNSWSNSFGPVDEADVSAIISTLADLPPKRTIWDGVYTTAQAERGAAEYGGPCGLCHGRRLNGAPDDPDMNSTPPLARAKFLRNWDGRSLAALYEYTRATMPQSNPGYMSDQVYVDILAHMLSMSEAPAGDEELPPDSRILSRITIVQE